MERPRQVPLQPRRFVFSPWWRISLCSRRSRPSQSGPAGTARSRQGRAGVWRGVANPCLRAPFWHSPYGFDGRLWREHILLVGLERFAWTAGPTTASALARRLITLIYAGWNRMAMIRRELPRTSCAGWVRRPFRIVFVEGSPFRGPSAVIGAAVRQNLTSLRCLG
jgi:hypothetical protein